MCVQVVHVCAGLDVSHVRAGAVINYLRVGVGVGGQDLSSYCFPCMCMIKYFRDNHVYIHQKQGLI